MAITLRIEFMDGKVTYIDFNMQEGDNKMFSWMPVNEGLMVKAHKETNRVVYPWHNIRSYAIHNSEVKEYRNGARPETR